MTSPAKDKYPRPANYPLGAVAFAVFLGVYKAAQLAADMGAGWSRFMAVLGSDAFFLALIFLAAWLQGFTRSLALRVLLRLTLAGMTLFYLVDSLVLLALDQHPGIFEVIRYTPEWAEIAGFVDMPAYALAGAWLVSVFVAIVSTPAVRRFAFGLFVVALLSAGPGISLTPPPVTRYAVLHPGTLLMNKVAEHPADSYSADEISFYAGLERKAAAIPSTRPNIILLVVESLSSINSGRTSGGQGFLDDFDVLSREGVLFQNFFANHQASEGGLIALLGGFPPMHFPTASPYMFDEFAIQPSVIGEYRQQGYFTDFLTNADLAFIGLDRFLAGLGLDRRRGRDEVEAMRNAPRVALDAPSDAFLYAEALAAVRQLQGFGQPFLLTLATTSTHLPYRHPEGGPDTALAVWTWSLQQLSRFYAQLADAGFFDNGILLVTGDHRQMRPLSEAEIQRYGDSARARVPLLVIGKGFPRGHADDRFFQQSDLLRMLGRIQQLDVPLSPYPVWVERYNRKYGRIELIDSLGVFDESGQGRREFRLKTRGNAIEWMDGKPGFSRELEARIHAQRSLHQQIRSGSTHLPAANQ